MGRRLAVILLAGDLGLAALSGAGAIDVETAVRMAERANRDLASQRVALTIAERKARNAWNELLPSLKLSATGVRANELSTYSTAETPWTASLALSASMSLSGATARAMRALALDYRAAEVAYEEAAASLELKVRKAFYGLLVARERIRQSEAELATAERRYAQARANYEAGLKPRLDVLAAQVSYETLKPTLAQRKAEYRQALAEFAVLVGAPSEEGLGELGGLVGSLEPEIPELDPEGLAASRVDRNFGVQKAASRVAVLENAVGLQSLQNFAPALTVSWSWAPTVSDPSAGRWADRASDAGQLVLSLGVPLDGLVPGSQRELAVAEARAQLEQAKLALEEARCQAELSIRSLAMQLGTARETLAALQLNVALAEETAQLTEQAYRQGTAEWLEVQAAADKLQAARLALLEQRLSALSALLDLEYQTGLSWRAGEPAIGEERQ